MKTIKDLMNTVYNICKKENLKDFMVDYIAETYCDLDRCFYIVLFNETLNMGNHIKELIQKEIGDELKEITVEQDDKSYAFSGYRNIQIWINFKDNYNSLTEHYSIINQKE